MWIYKEIAVKSVVSQAFSLQKKTFRNPKSSLIEPPYYQNLQLQKKLPFICNAVIFDQVKFYP